MLESQKLILIRDSSDFNPPEISNSLSLCGIMKLLSRDKSEPVNRPLPSSKNPHFQNEAKGTTFLVEMRFICMRRKNNFHIKGRALNLVLIQRPGGTRSEVAYLLKIIRKSRNLHCLYDFINLFNQCLFIKIRVLIVKTGVI